MAGPSGQSSTVARNVICHGRLEAALATWRHRVGSLVTLLPPGGIGLASPFRRRAEDLWDYEEALLSIFNNDNNVDALKTNKLVL